MIEETVLSAVETGFGTGTTLVLVGLISATLGTIVAGLAYRGYARNDSGPMLYLSIGVAFLTVVPFLLSHTIATVTAASDADVLLVITICNLIGLVTIAYSLRRT